MGQRSCSMCTQWPVSRHSYSLALTLVRGTELVRSPSPWKGGRLGRQRRLPAVQGAGHAPSGRSHWWRRCRRTRSNNIQPISLICPISTQSVHYRIAFDGIVAAFSRRGRLLNESNSLHYCGSRRAVRLLDAGASGQQQQVWPLQQALARGGRVAFESRWPHQKYPALGR